MQDMDVFRIQVMAKIHGEFMPEKGLTIFTIEGNASKSDMLQIITGLEKKPGDPGYYLGCFTRYRGRYRQE